MIKQSLLLIFPVLSLSLLIPVSAVFSQQVQAENFTLQGSLKIYKKGGKKTLRRFDNAVVYLEGISASVPEQLAEVDQRKKKFHPRLLPVVQGQTVRFYNWDKVEHNVFSTEEKNSFDLGRYPREDFRDRPYVDPGLYKIYCNIHKAMILDILVVPSRYYAVTNKKGEYQIKNVPAGEYTLKAWHIYGGSAELPIAVKQDTNFEEIILNSTRVVHDIKNHLNKFGKKYKRSGSRYRGK